MDRELYSIEQARALLGGIARNTLHDLLRSGALASVPIGRRRFISARAPLRRLLPRAPPPTGRRGRWPRPRRRCRCG